MRRTPWQPSRRHPRSRRTTRTISGASATCCWPNTRSRPPPRLASGSLRSMPGTRRRCERWRAPSKAPERRMPRWGRSSGRVAGTRYTGGPGTRRAPFWGGCAVPMGLCPLRTGHAAEALPCFDFVLKASSKDARVLTWKGEANEALGRNAEAFAAFDSAIESNPEFGEAWRDKGLLHVKSEQFTAAADALAHATVARPTDKALWYMRGFSEERAGEFDAAVQSD